MQSRAHTPFPSSRKRTGPTTGRYPGSFAVLKRERSRLCAAKARLGREARLNFRSKKGRGEVRAHFLVALRVPTRTRALACASGADTHPRAAAARARTHTHTHALGRHTHTHTACFGHRHTPHTYTLRAHTHTHIHTPGADTHTHSLVLGTHTHTARQSLHHLSVGGERVEVGQQRIEAAGAVAGVEVDAADLLDQPLQRLQLLQADSRGLSSISFAVLSSERVAAVSSWRRIRWPWPPAPPPRPCSAARARRPAG